jgi:hypothetical protein
LIPKLGKVNAGCCERSRWIALGDAVASIHNYHAGQTIGIEPDKPKERVDIISWLEAHAPLRGYDELAVVRWVRMFVWIRRVQVT